MKRRPKRQPRTARTNAAEAHIPLGMKPLRRICRWSDVEAAQQRTDVEQHAALTQRLANDVARNRRNISSLESALATERTTLASNMLEHQKAVVKLTELVEIAQPMA